MRCENCNKFVPYDDGNVDDVEAEIDEDTGEVTVTGRVVLPCAECGSDLKELSVEDTCETADEFKSVLDAVRAAIPEAASLVDDAWVEANCEVKYEFDGDPDKEFTERTQRTVKVPIKAKGKVVGYKERPIKNARYMKTFKGVCVSGTVKRTITFTAPPTRAVTTLTDTAEFEHTVEEQASAFDEC